MKPKFIVAALIITLPLFANAQLQELMNKIKNKVDQRIDNKVDKQINNNGSCFVEAKISDSLLAGRSVVSGKENAVSFWRLKN